MSSKNPMVPKSEKKVKEVISNMETDKTQAFKKYVFNESNKGTALNKSTSLDNSRSSTRTETSSSLSEKDTKSQQPKEIKFRSVKLRIDTSSISSMSVHVANITTVIPDKDISLARIKKI